METEVLENGEMTQLEEVEESPKQKLKTNTFMDKLKKYTKYNWQIYLLFLPAFIWMNIFVFIPFISNVLMSFQDYSIDK